MIVAADSSSLIRMAWSEAGSDAVIAAYRRMGRPELIVSDVILLEVRTGIRAKAFIEKSSQPLKLHAGIDREKARAESRLNAFAQRNLFRVRTSPWHEWLDTAHALSTKWAEKNGARTLDLLHIAFALRVGCTHFLTCDARQAIIANGEKLTVVEGAVTGSK